MGLAEHETIGLLTQAFELVMLGRGEEPVGVAVEQLAFAGEPLGCAT